MINRFLRVFRNLLFYPYLKEIFYGMKRSWFPVFIKYPVYPKPKHSYNVGKPYSYLYEIIHARQDEYASTLMLLKEYKEDFLRIQSVQPDEAGQPYWNNPWFSGLDAIALYGFIANRKPKLYLEIGSGNSTKFVKRAILDHKLSTQIVSVDPYPRVEIDSLSDEVIRMPLEEIDFGIFDRLTENDILFFDGSHRCFMNSDVTVFFLEILPKLPSGILIHIHDIYLPYDYPVERAYHYESEQYLFGAMLIGECTKYQIVLPNMYISCNSTLMNGLNGLFDSQQATIPPKGLLFMD